MKTKGRLRFWVYYSLSRTFAAMIKRIVKLTFHSDKIHDFQTLFEGVKHQIRSFPGCEHLELWQDENDPRVFFTYSFWNSPQDLEHYRHSELFQSTWKETKVLFDDRPQAWSVKLVNQVEQ